MYRVEKAGTQPKPLPARDRNFGAAEYLGSMSGVRRGTFDSVGRAICGKIVHEAIHQITILNLLCGHQIC